LFRWGSPREKRLVLVSTGAYLVAIAGLALCLINLDGFKARTVSPLMTTLIVVLVVGGAVTATIVGIKSDREHRRLRLMRERGDEIEP
jgi:hypothetical protein